MTMPRSTVVFAAGVTRLARWSSAALNAAARTVARMSWQAWIYVAAIAVLIIVHTTQGG